MIIPSTFGNSLSSFPSGGQSEDPQFIHGEVINSWNITKVMRLAVQVRSVPVFERWIFENSSARQFPAQTALVPPVPRTSLKRKRLHGVLVPRLKRVNYRVPRPTHRSVSIFESQYVWVSANLLWQERCFNISREYEFLGVFGHVIGIPLTSDAFVAGHWCKDILSWMSLVPADVRKKSRVVIGESDSVIHLRLASAMRLLERDTCMAGSI
jgi:hypothetical protein